MGVRHVVCCDGLISVSTKFLFIGLFVCSKCLEVHSCGMCGNDLFLWGNKMFYLLLKSRINLWNLIISFCLKIKLQIAIYSFSFYKNDSELCSVGTALLSWMYVLSLLFLVCSSREPIISRRGIHENTKTIYRREEKWQQIIINWIRSERNNPNDRFSSVAEIFSWKKFKIDLSPNGNQNHPWILGLKHIPELIVRISF